MSSHLPSHQDRKAPLADTDRLFVLYLLLLVIEFLGLTQVLPILAVSRVSTLLAWGLFLAVLVKVGPRAFVESPQSRLLTGFLFFTGLTVFYAVVQMSALTAFRTHLDYFALFLITAYLVDRPARVKKLAVVLSAIAIVMVVRNVAKLSSPSRAGAMVGAYFVGDGNDFAWALCVFVPMALFLTYRQQGGVARTIGFAAVVACLFGVVGTQSRGAALAVVSMAAYHWVTVAKRRMLAASLAVLFVVGLTTLGPAYYVERLSTIQSYQEDGSAAGRLKMWGIAIRMAVDYPFGVGAGNFSVAYGLRYLPEEDMDYSWGSRRWLSAHSVYFRALGEYGFAGLLLLLATIGTNFVANEQSHRLAREKGASAAERAWPRLLNMSLVGYSVGGAFLGGLTYPHLYLISALAAGTRAMLEVAEPTTQAVEAVPGRAASARVQLPSARPQVPAVIRPRPRHPAVAPSWSPGDR